MSLLEIGRISGEAWNSGVFRFSRANSPILLGDAFFIRAMNNAFPNRNIDQLCKLNTNEARSRLFKCTGAIFIAQKFNTQYVLEFVVLAFGPIFAMLSVQCRTAIGAHATTPDKQDLV